MYDYDCDIGALIKYKTGPSIQNLSLDLLESVISCLQRKDIHSFMRSNQNNLLLCQQYISKLITTKFNHLLTHKSTSISLHQLLIIPFVDTITINATDMPLYFGNINNDSRNVTSSKYIGLERNTNNALISFWLKKIQIDTPKCKIMTIVFNATNIDCIYFSDTMGPFSFKYPMQRRALRNDVDDSNDIKAIYTLLSGAKVQILSKDNAMWCSNELWESYMIWPRMKHAVCHPHPNTTLMLVSGLASLLIILGVLLIHKYSSSSQSSASFK